MHYEYTPKRVCSRKILFDIEEGVVKNIKFLGGCSGNTQGVARLSEGRTPQQIIDRILGTKCLIRGTSCPDQLARALKEAITKKT